MPCARKVARIAAGQHGVISYRQLLGRRGCAATIERRVKRGHLHRIYRGVYAVGHADLSHEGRWLAAVLTYGEGAVLSHESAAHLWTMSPTSPSLIHVTVPAQRKGQAQRHRPSPPDHAEPPRRNEPPQHPGHHPCPHPPRPRLGQGPDPVGAGAGLPSPARRAPDPPPRDQRPHRALHRGLLLAHRATRGRARLLRIPLRPPHLHGRPRPRPLPHDPRPPGPALHRRRAPREPGRNRPLPASPPFSERYSTLDRNTRPHRGHPPHPLRRLRRRRALAPLLRRRARRARPSSRASRRWSSSRTAGSSSTSAAARPRTNRRSRSRRPQTSTASTPSSTSASPTSPPSTGSGASAAPSSSPSRCSARPRSVPTYATPTAISSRSVSSRDR